MRVLDLFSGIGGFSLGLERAGMTTIAFCEIDPYCRAVLKKHWPDVPCHDDITTREFREGEADFITAGFPCQDISAAGKCAGLSGSRSGLFWEVVRAIRLVRPIGALLENVADLLHRGMGEVLGALAESGHDAEWDCIPARAVGAPHGRDRIWIAAYPDRRGRGANVAGRDHGDGANAGRAQGDRQPGALPGERDQRQVASSANADRSWGLQPGWVFSKVRQRLDDGVASASEWATSWPEKLSQISRMDDGLSDRLDKAGIDATGNAVVPQIPEIIGRAIMESRP